MDNIRGVFINLEKRPDRRHQFESQTLPFRVDRFQAVENATNGHLGCAQSHIKALQQLACQNGQPGLADQAVKLDAVCIFEDDFQATASPDEMTRVLQKFLSDFYGRWDVLVMSASTYGLKSTPPENGNGKVHRLHSAQTTAAYLVHPDYIPTLVTCFQQSVDALARGQPPREAAIDQMWKSLMTRDRFYLTVPPLGKQRDSYSDIERKTVSYPSV